MQPCRTRSGVQWGSDDVTERISAGLPRHQFLEPQGIAKLVTDADIPGKAGEALTRSGVAERS
jgi:hypothetical protein